ncbi:hypothetical protein HDV03_002533 [Kappamyces sp. JEL0829]|nr:hypothetical protein HDV03_002533 [Kappamyces sp. JEL0829]
MADTGDSPPLGLSHSIIGVAVAILGNILISLALNVQKYAHNLLLNTPGTIVYDSDSHYDGERRGLLPQTLALPEAEAADLPVAGSYLSSKFWWLGVLLMVLGECGNFVAYGFAPAVLVAPLGTVALISNIAIAPFFLGERMRKQDVFGIFASILGTCIILAVSTSTSEPSLSVDDIINALLQPTFLLYVAITMVCLVLLLRYSNTDYAKNFIMVDLLIAALLGGYTVLSIKALSSLLKLDFYRMLSHGITYFMLLVLTGTGVLQIHYLNKALSNFDSVEVIPTNFVLFTTFSIVGSAVLYNDLSRTSPMALLGVVFMFLGVILITSKTPDEYSTVADVSPSRELGSPIQNQSWQAYHEWTRTHQPVLNPPNSSVNGEICDSSVPVDYRRESADQSPFSTSLPIPVASPTPPHHRPFRSPAVRPVSTPQRASVRTSWEGPTSDGKSDTALRRLSGILTSVGTSVGTSGIRKMEFDHLAELAQAAHASSSYPKTDARPSSEF